MRLIVVGESHHGAHLEQIKNFFKDLYGLDGIFIELPVDFKKSVDYYLSNREVDEKLCKHFEGAAREGKNVKDTELFVLNFAKQKNIPVICIDSSKIRTNEYQVKSEMGHYFLRGESRDEDMFRNIINVIKDDQTWLLFGGKMHFINETHHRTGRKTLGSWLKEKNIDLDLQILIEE